MPLISTVLGVVAVAAGARLTASFHTISHQHGRVSGRHASSLLLTNLSSRMLPASSSAPASGERVQGLEKLGNDCPAARDARRWTGHRREARGRSQAPADRPCWSLECGCSGGLMVENRRPLDGLAIGRESGCGRQLEKVGWVSSWLRPPGRRSASRGSSAP